ncbi:LysR family transcriptional regulator [Sagittula sp. MA-2]|jgi:DNA-binding transcriptional LysR family regulator|uniref:LysR family transcriptional regulator n=1 Tax=Sagittula sp. MA-2 TaxID=3048007 RepID=UPI0024C3372F|nr:LysR family transcriptional regulator [Sagittula sp. MA-2]WHZ33666.1 LysR family transcriptional regulator [Sagittula sp. MA-2]
MDRFDEMRVFIRVAETRSFRRAAESLGLPRSTVTEVIKRMESRLGVRLLDRTTRVVAPTLDGEAWQRRCVSIVSEVEDAESAFSNGAVRGRLRVDVHGTLARHFLLPGLPDFLAENPELALVLSEGDRLVDLIREGVDCVIRVGEPADSELILRRLGTLPEAVAAAPAYLDRHGIPETPDDLEGHKVVAFLSSKTGVTMDLAFTLNGREVTRPLPAALITTGAETMVEAARLGLGLIQVPRYHLAADIAAGRLVEVLSAYTPPPTPIIALYPRDRQLTPRLRIFLDWLAKRSFVSEGLA